MRSALLVFLLAGAVAGLPLAQEERPVPKDSARISIPGCAKGTRFIVGQTPAHEPRRSEIAPGRRFRLNGRKEVIKEIKKEEGHMIEITGLVRRADLAGPGGISLGGGVRIGGGPPQSGVPDARRNIGTLDPVLDVESWRPLADPCGLR